MNNNINTKNITEFTLPEGIETAESMLELPTNFKEPVVNEFEPPVDITEFRLPKGSEDEVTNLIPPEESDAEEPMIRPPTEFKALGSTELKPLTDFKPNKLVDVMTQKPKQPYQRRCFNNIPILAFDCEWERNGDVNDIISAQFYISHNGNSCGDIIYTKGSKKSDRIKLTTFIAQATEYGIEKGVLNGWPKDLYMVAYFLRADLFTFTGAFDLKGVLKGVRQTVVQGQKMYSVDVDSIGKQKIRHENATIYDKNRNKHTMNINFYDTMLLSPNGKGLAAIGDLVGIKKVTIPPEYSIERMRELLEKAPEIYHEYALRDAEIACRHFELMLEFCDREFDIKRLPFTVGGIAVKVFLKMLEGKHHELFGLEEHTREIWPENKLSPITQTNQRPDSNRSILEWFAIEGYMGGRNENMITGPTEIKNLYDFDIKSAYTAAINGCRPLDYANLKQITDITELVGDVWGIARVEFVSPDHVRYPALPVNTDKYGIYFPQEGVSYATSHEIQVALNLGYKVKLIQGFIIPWASEQRIFQPFMEMVRTKRDEHIKGSFEERLFKEIGNSLYGKTAQGLRNKSAFDMSVGFNKALPPSKLTNAYFASYTTGLVRAIIAEMMNSIPRDKVIVSVTTDGFLTDATVDEIKLDGEICNRFREHYKSISGGDGGILELKHQAKQIIGMKTRGQITGEYGEKSTTGDTCPPVIARAGVQLPDGSKGTWDGNEYMVDLYVNRYPGQKVMRKSLISLGQQMVTESDFVEINSKIKLNLEPDFKRCLTNPRMGDIRGIPHIVCDSVPHKNKADGEFMRVRFDRWRETSCLKTMEDYESWEDFLGMSTATQGSRLRIKAGERSDELLQRLFIRCYAKKKLNLQRTYNYRELADWFTDNGYKITHKQVSNYTSGKIFVGVVPVTIRTVKLLSSLLEIFPDFDYEQLFYAPDISKLQKQIADD